MNLTIEMTNSLPPRPVLMQLEAAEGWLMLGNPSEASAEMQQIPPRFQSHALVLAMHWKVAEAAGQPQNSWEAARRLCELIPTCAEAWICQATSLRKCRGPRAAADLLLGVVGRFPKESVLHYNLACYLTALGEFREACAHLLHVFQTEERKGLQSLALLDPDLAPLWQKISPGTSQTICPGNRR